MKGLSEPKTAEKVNLVNDRGKPEYTGGKKPVPVSLMHHKTYKDWSGIELRPPQWARTIKHSTIYKHPISSSLNNFCK